MKTLTIALTTLLTFSSLAHAECANAYKDQIKNLEGKMNPPRTTVIANTVGEAALVGSLIVLTGTAAPAAVLALPVAAVGAGAYYGGLVIKRNGLRNGMHVIRDAHKGSGKTLDRFMKVLAKKMKTEVNRDEVINLLVQGDYDNTFCQQDEVSDKYSLMSFRKLARHIRKELDGVDEVETDELADAEAEAL